MKISHIDHINIVVEDLRGAITFFERLGFENKASKELSGEWVDSVVGLKDVKARFASMELPGGKTVIELLKYYKPKSNVKLSNGNGPANRPGYRHIALEVTDIEGWHNRLRSEGIECFSEVQNVPNYKNKRLFYFRGPEGIIIELTDYK